jgi:hypothetical protein
VYQQQRFSRTVGFVVKSYALVRERFSHGWI